MQGGREGVAVGRSLQNPVSVSDLTRSHLDEALIEFGASLEYKGLDRAVEILEPLELTPETEANWKTVAKLALEQQNLLVAERCYAALGNISKASYLRKMNKLVAQEGINNFRV